MESLADHSREQPCDGCPRCREVIQTAIALYKQGITEEHELVPTLMLARMFAGTNEQRREIVEKHPNLEPVEVRGDVPVVRLKSLAVNAEKHAGTRVLKQVRVRVVSKHVKSQDVQTQYRQALLEEGVRWDENNHGHIFYMCIFGYLELVIAAGADRLSPHTVEGMGGESLTLSHPAFHFPQPEVVAGVYQGLLGADWGEKQYGFAGDLDVYGRSKKQRSPEKLIPAFVAWHIGTQTGEKIPPKSRSVVARVMNKNLLSPLGMRELIEEQTNPDDTVWRDVQDLFPRFVRLQQFIRYPSHKGSPLITDI